MADGLISVDVLKSRVLQGQFKIGQDGTWYVLGLIDSMPTIEAEPIRHGRWIEEDDAIIHGHCSSCGWVSVWQETDVLGMNYCPNCGARMDEDDA